MREKLSKANIIIPALGSLILIFISIKAYNSSFTHDESYSYLRYIHISFMDIITHKNSYTNNHLLNSLLMKCSEQVFGTSEISLRLPNLILLVIYMSYSYLLFREANQVFTIGIFLLLCSNNALIDLFGLARGYGLSCGFMLMSLYHFIHSFYNEKVKNMLLFHLGGLLAILSSFTLLDFYISLLLIYNLITFVESKLITNGNYNFLKTNKVNIIPLVTVIILLYNPVSRVIIFNNLDFGGKLGFYNDTIKQLICYTFHCDDLSPLLFFITQIIFTGIVLVTFNMIIRLILKGNFTFFREQKGLIISNLLIIFISLELVFQHILFKTDYPILRFSIFLFPLFIVHFGFLLMYFSKNQFKKTINITLISLATISCISFIIKADFYSCAEWRYDMETKNMVEELEKFHNKTEKETMDVTLGINWLFEPTINFYRQSKNLKWLREVDRNPISKTKDYYYIFKDQLSQLDSVNYQVIAEFKKLNTILIKNNKPN